ncbi:FAD-dependent oxidoreductase [Berryella wangjianweii]|uniref:FAD-dependent oxidoreductase n=1 Tax=Berryella wangjianweii TaxID=2734634 RepID=A0A6M8J4K9_9ACTN|nr:FAD-dependent oxidoreductase [Berryella wangjianweii]QKF07563.1 FAD-dependent oxidoreductase [Berryella wangjianweii]
MSITGTDFDRRTFLKGAAAAGAVTVGAGALASCAPGGKGGKTAKAPAEVGGYSFEKAPDPIPDSEVKQTVEAEVVVIGAGPSGLVTALSAVEQGLDVVLIAQSPNVVARGGSNAAVNSRYLRSLGLGGVTPRFLLEQIAQASFNFDVNKWYRWMNRSEEAMDWIIERTSARPELKLCVEQSNEWPDDMKTYPLYGPSMSHCWNSRDYPIVADGQPSLALALRELLEQAGARLFFGVQAQQLVRGGKPNGTEGRVDAVIAKGGDGSYVKYVGKKAVVLATGDFSGDREMMEKYAPECVEWVQNWNLQQDPDVLDKVYGGLYTGQGQKMGLWVGAAWQRTWPNAVMAATFAAPNPNPWNAPSTLMVTDRGMRFCCEDMGCGHLPYLIKHVGPVNAIFDSKYPARNQPWHNWKNVHGEGDQTPEEVLAAWDGRVEKKTMVKANTLDELAQAMGVDPAGLKKSVERYNELVAAGVDEDFHKRPELLHPIDTPPFYGWRKEAPMLLTVMGGLRTSIDMEVCDADDKPIEGLYNVGTMVGDCYANSYNFLIEGHNHGMNCITFGYLTGRHIAGK